MVLRLSVFLITVTVAQSSAAQIVDMSERVQATADRLALKKADNASSGVYEKTKNVAYASRPGFMSDVAWDMFHHAGNPVWMCREVATKNFVPPRFCAGKIKNDTHWPDTHTPEEFNGEIGETAP